MDFSWSAAPTYEEVVRFFDSLIDYEKTKPQRFHGETRESDLERFRNILTTIGNPQFHAPAFHIAGTKGKGSTCAILASILTAAGLRTGLYTSPHLESYCERLRVGGETIPPQEFAAHIAALSRFVVSNTHPRAEGFRTVFELLTACAFQYFRERNIDAAVIETGLGGRLDATNVFQPRGLQDRPPLVNVITTIGFDHTEILGDTIEQIAGEKAGIIQSRAQVVVASQPLAYRETVKRIIRVRCEEVGVSHPFFADELLEFRSIEREENRQAQPSQRALFTLSERGRSYLPGSELVDALSQGLEVELGTPGLHQLENLRTAVVACIAAESAGACHVPPDAVKAGAKVVHWPGRFEILSHEPPVVVDGAHCELSTRAMAETFSKLWGKRRVHVVFGLMQDKHIERILPALEDRLSAVRFYCCTPPSPRGRRAEEVARVVETLIGVPAIAASSPEEAVDLAWESAASNGDAILCFGSFYLVAPWIKALRQHLPSHAEA